ncbi:MAG: hypothetical protein II746_08310 [Bacteroidaceae bacterium]|nr:hypothetical protein [Bacteroidaceae bacterium]
MKRFTEGNKMFLSVMAVFVVYASFFILFEDYDRHVIQPLTDESDWHLLLFSMVVMMLLGFLLHRYSKRMDRRIDREQALRQSAMRRELTQNIAHELKTPVASIMGYAETLMDNPDLPEAMRQQFVHRTHEQARRLSALLQDISTLNRMDSAPEQVAMQEVNLSELVSEIVREAMPRMEGRGMTFINQMPDSVCLMGNPQLLYSIFGNLLDNAINYAGTDTTLTLTAQRQGPMWHFCFSDDGVGVTAEHLSRIFERFYRVDKGRSRETGGTGLGLAIVKNAVMLHGGSIHAAVSPGGHGLSFSFTLRGAIVGEAKG